MKRDRNHALEDNSIAAFKLLLPELWVLHTYQKDYGIDVQIELFDKSGITTGLRVYGQLKATDKDANNDVLSLDREHFEYWAAHSDPVLLIRYFTTTKSFKWCWMHEIEWRLKPKSSSVNVSKHLRNWEQDSTYIDIERLLELRKEILFNKLTAPITISIIDHINGLRGGIELSQKIRCLLPKKSFSVMANAEVPSHFSVDLEKNKICLGHLGLSGYVVSLDRKINTDEVAELAVLLIFLVACRYDRSLVAKSIAEASSKTLCKTAPEQLELLLIDNLIYAIGVTKTIAMVMKNRNPSYDPLFLFKLSLAGSRASKKYGQSEEWFKHLKKWAIAPPYAEMGGTEAYNYANAIAHNGLWQESLDYYSLAAQRDKKYLNRDYYWAEIGAAQFECTQYSESAKSYQRSYDITPDPQTAWRLGDALFHSGNYEQAYITLKDAFTQSQSLGSYPLLVMMVCDELVTFWGIKEQEIKLVENESQKKLMALKPASSEAGLISYLKPFLDICAIDGLASFNAGHFARLSNQHQISMFRFLTCGLRQRWDAQAWAQAFLSAMQAQNTYAMALIVECAYFYVGEELIDATLKSFSFSENTDKQIVAEIENSLVSLIRSAVQNKDESVTMRIHGHDETKSFVI